LKHIPVLLKETLEYLQIKPNGCYLDGTLGAGGHALEVAKRLNKEGTLVGVDQDPALFEKVTEKLKDTPPQKKLMNLRFDQVDQLKEFLPFDGILLDLGYSSDQLENPEYGLSWKLESPLDMRLDKTEKKMSAGNWLNHTGFEEMWKAFEVEGELPRSKTLAQAIVDIRAKKPFRVNQDFLTVIQDVYRSDKSIKFQMIYNQIFQAIRIVVNHEKDNLKKFLENYLNWLSPGGRLVIISFHSGEDRLVKEAFAKEAKDCLCPPFYPVCKCGHQKQIKILTKKPIVASSEEIKVNSRSASAKLRAIQKL